MTGDEPKDAISGTEEEMGKQKKKEFYEAMAQ